MSDLVERLRNKESVFVAKDCKEAADEIERLIAVLEEIADNDDSYYRVGGFLAEKALQEVDKGLKIGS